MVGKAVIFDFYNTLAETTNFGPSWEELVTELGYDLPPDVRERWWNDGIDGTEHDEHSASRDHYVAWQQSRVRAMLGDCGVPSAVQDVFIERVREISAHNRIDAYEEVGDVLERAPGARRGARDLLELGLGPARGHRGRRTHRVVRRDRFVGVGRSPQAAPPHLHAHAGGSRRRARGRALRRRHVRPATSTARVPRACARCTSGATHLGVDHTAPGPERIPTDVHLARDLRAVGAYGWSDGSQP